MRDQAIVARQVAVEDLDDPKLARLLAYWTKQRDGRTLPLRRDLLPEDMGELLGRLALIEVASAPASYRFRLVGTKLRHVFDRDLTGLGFDRLEPRHLEALLRDYCDAALAGREPLCIEVIAKRNNQTFRYAVLILPLSSHGEAADMLLLAFNWRSSEVPLFHALDRGPG